MKVLRSAAACTSFLLLCVASLSHAGIGHRKNVLKVGLWRGALTTNSRVEIPFIFEVTGDKIIVQNADERLAVDEITTKGDSVFLVMPFFNSEFRVKAGDAASTLVGVWIRHLPGRDVRMPFKATFGELRFQPTQSTRTLTGTWDLKIEGAQRPSVGTFSQIKGTSRITGSILKVTGDDRYLDGVIRGDSLYLSTFDGSHALLLTAHIGAGGKTLEGGKIYSGISSVSSWTASFNPGAKLPDPYSITRIKDGPFDFTFTDSETGAKVSLHDLRFKNKVVIVQFMGSWCPNCMDETAFLTRFYESFLGQVEIVGLAYERSAKPDSAAGNVNRLKKRFGVKYPLLLTGHTNQPEEVMKSLPALVNFTAFPTTLLIDKSGKVSSIHTGFSGPGTGKYYDEFVNDFTQKVEKLIAAK